MEEGQDGNLAYDLRQRYAKIVGDHLEDIAIFRKNRNYPDYFRSLEDLHTVVQHKFKNNYKEVKQILKEKGKADKTNKVKITYVDLKGKVIELATEYSNAWSGNGMDSNEVALIEGALRSAEMFLYDKMDEANMFGSKRETEGLV